MEMGDECYECHHLDQHLKDVFIPIINLEELQQKRKEIFLKLNHNSSNQLCSLWFFQTTLKKVLEKSCQAKKKILPGSSLSLTQHNSNSTPTTGQHEFPFLQLKDTPLQASTPHTTSGCSSDEPLINERLDLSPDDLHFKSDSKIAQRSSPHIDVNASRTPSNLILSLGIGLDDSRLSWTSSLATPPAYTKEDTLPFEDESQNQQSKRKTLVRALFSPDVEQSSSDGVHQLSPSRISLFRNDNDNKTPILRKVSSDKILFSPPLFETKESSSQNILSEPDGNFDRHSPSILSSDSALERKGDHEKISCSFSIETPVSRLRTGKRLHSILSTKRRISSTPKHVHFSEPSLNLSNCDKSCKVLTSGDKLRQLRCASTSLSEIEILPLMQDHDSSHVQNTICINENLNDVETSRSQVISKTEINRSSNARPASELLKTILDNHEVNPTVSPCLKDNSSIHHSSHTKVNSSIMVTSNPNQSSSENIVSNLNCSENINSNLFPNFSEIITPNRKTNSPGNLNSDKTLNLTKNAHSDSNSKDNIISNPNLNSSETIISDPNSNSESFNSSLSLFMVSSPNKDPEGKSINSIRHLSSSGSSIASNQITPNSSSSPHHLAADSSALKMQTKKLPQNSPIKLNSSPTMHDKNQIVFTQLSSSYDEKLISEVDQLFKSEIHSDSHDIKPVSHSEQSLQVTNKICEGKFIEEDSSSSAVDLGLNTSTGNSKLNLQVQSSPINENNIPPTKTTNVLKPPVSNSDNTHLTSLSTAHENISVYPCPVDTGVNSSKPIEGSCQSKPALKNSDISSSSVTPKSVSSLYGKRRRRVKDFLYPTASQINHTSPLMTFNFKVAGMNTYKPDDRQESKLKPSTNSVEDNNQEKNLTKSPQQNLENENLVHLNPESSLKAVGSNSITNKRQPQVPISKLFDDKDNSQKYPKSEVTENSIHNSNSTELLEKAVQRTEAVISTSEDVQKARMIDSPQSNNNKTGSVLKDFQITENSVTEIHENNIKSCQLNKGCQILESKVIVSNNRGKAFETPSLDIEDQFDISKKVKVLPDIKSPEFSMQKEPDQSDHKLSDKELLLNFNSSVQPNLESPNCAQNDHELLETSFFTVSQIASWKEMNSFSQVFTENDSSDKKMYEDNDQGDHSDFKSSQDNHKNKNCVETLNLIRNNEEILSNENAKVSSLCEKPFEVPIIKKEISPDSDLDKGYVTTSKGEEENISYLVKEVFNKDLNLNSVDHCLDSERKNSQEKQILNPEVFEDSSSTDYSEMRLKESRYSPEGKEIKESIVEPLEINNGIRTHHKKSNDLPHDSCSKKIIGSNFPSIIEEKNIKQHKEDLSKTIQNLSHTDHLSSDTKLSIKLSSQKGSNLKNARMLHKGFRPFKAPRILTKNSKIAKSLELEEQNESRKAEEIQRLKSVVINQEKVGKDYNQVLMKDESFLSEVGLRVQSVTESESEKLFSTKTKHLKSEILNEEKKSEDIGIIGMSTVFTTEKLNQIGIKEESLTKAKKILNEEGSSKVIQPIIQPIQGSGFSTAKGKPISVKDESLKNAQVLFNEDNEGSTLEKQIPVSKGFSTAKGKQINVKEESLRKAQVIFNEENEGSTLEKQIPVSKGFSTAKGKQINVKEESLRKAQVIFNEGGSAMEKQIPASKGFSTAKGKPISVKDESLKKAQVIFNEENEGSTLEKQIPVSKGFSTAKGKPISVKDESLKKAQVIFNEENEGSTLEKQIPVSKGFSTAKGKPISVKDESLKKAQVIFNEENEGSTVEKQIPVSKGFSTAKGKPISVKDESLKKAQVIFNEENEGSTLEKQIPVSKGFSTAKGKPISVKDESLKKAQVIFNEENEGSTVEKQIPVSKGFSTAKGKPISVKDESLKKAQVIFNEENEGSTVEKQIPVSKGFSTAKGKPISVKDESLKKAQVIFNEENEGSTLEKQIPVSKGFSTAKGKPISVKDESLKKAQVIFNEENEGSTVEKQIPVSKGFSTAKGKPISVKDESLKKAQVIFNEENEGSTLEKQIPVSKGFSTAKGKPISVKDESLKKAQVIFNEENEGSTMEKQIPVSKGFSTAKGKPINVKDESLKKAQVIFNEELGTEVQLMAGSSTTKKTTSFQEECLKSAHIALNYENGQSQEVQTIGKPGKISSTIVMPICNEDTRLKKSENLTSPLPDNSVKVVDEFAFQDENILVEIVNSMDENVLNDLLSSDFSQSQMNEGSSNLSKSYVHCKTSEESLNSKPALSKEVAVAYNSNDSIEDILNSSWDDESLPLSNATQSIQTFDPASTNKLKRSVSEIDSDESDSIVKRAKRHQSTDLCKFPKSQEISDDVLMESVTIYDNFLDTDSKNIFEDCKGEPAASIAKEKYSNGECFLNENEMTLSNEQSKEKRKCSEVPGESTKESCIDVDLLSDLQNYHSLQQNDDNQTISSRNENSCNTENKELPKKEGTNLGTGQTCFTFQTGLGHQVPVSHESLQKAIQSLNSSTESTNPDLQSRSFPVFQTGRGQKVHVSEKSLHEAVKTLNKQCDPKNESLNKQVPNQKKPQSETFVAFQTGLGKDVHVSVKSINKVQKILNDDSSRESFCSEAKYPRIESPSSGSLLTPKQVFHSPLDATFQTPKQNISSDLNPHVSNKSNFVISTFKNLQHEANKINLLNQKKTSVSWKVQLTSPDGDCSRSSPLISDPLEFFSDQRSNSNHHSFTDLVSGNPMDTEKVIPGNLSERNKTNSSCKKVDFKTPYLKTPSSSQVKEAEKVFPKISRPVFRGYQTLMNSPQKKQKYPCKNVGSSTIPMKLDDKREQSKKISKSFPCPTNSLPGEIKISVPEHSSLESHQTLLSKDKNASFSSSDSSSVVNHPSAVVNHPSSVVNHPSAVVNHPSSVVNHPSAVVNHPSSVVNHPSAVVNHPSAVVNHPSSVVNHPSSVVNHPSAVVNHPSSVVNHPSSVVNHPSSVVNHPSSVVNHPSSVVNHPSSVVNHPSAVVNHPSSVVNHPSAVVNHPSSVVNHPSAVVNHPSSVVNHPSAVVNHPSSLVNPSSVVNHPSSVMNHPSSVVAEISDNKQLEDKPLDGKGPEIEKNKSVSNVCNSESLMTPKQVSKLTEDENVSIQIQKSKEKGTTEFVQSSDDIDNSGNGSLKTACAKNKENVGQNPEFEKTFKNLDTESKKENFCQIESHLEESRLEQDMIIIGKKRKKILPNNGILFNQKASKKRIKFSDFIQITNMSSWLPEQFYSFGVDSSTLLVTSLNAADYCFQLSTFYNVHCLHRILLGDGAILVPNSKFIAGKEEFFRAFQTIEGVDPQLISVQWFYNHYRWIIWKLAAYEVNFAPHFGGRGLHPEMVALQLKFRYDVEIDKCQRSALRRIIERDDSPAKRLVLCVSGINQELKNSDSTEQQQQQKTSSNLEVTDGWYATKLFLNGHLSWLVSTGKLRMGQKLCLSNAELVGSSTACHPLESPESLGLKVSSNCCRPAPWNAKLGFQSDPRPLCLPLTQIAADGGLVGCVDVIISRIYPIRYMEKVPGGKSVFRTSRAENFQEQRHEVLQQEAAEKLYNRLQSSFEDCCPTQDSKKCKIWSREEIQQMDNGQDLYEAMRSALQPDTFLDCLSESQLLLLADYKRLDSDLKAQKIKEEFQKAISDENNSNLKRNVTPVMKVRLIGCGQIDRQQNASTILTIWRPSEDLQEMLKEGHRYQIYNLIPSSNRSFFLSGLDAHLTATRSTHFQSVKRHPSIPKEIFLPRKVWSATELQSAASSVTEYHLEVDVTGIVLRITKVTTKQRKLELLHVVDTEGNILVIRFWGGLQVFFVNDLLLEGVVFAGLNLLLHRPPSIPEKNCSSVATLDVSSEVTHFSVNPYQDHLIESIKQLQQLKLSGDFLAESKSKVDSLLSASESLPTLHKSPAIMAVHQEGVVQMEVDERRKKQRMIQQAKCSKLLSYGSGPKLSPFSIRVPTNVRKAFKPPSITTTTTTTKDKNQ